MNVNFNLFLTEFSRFFLKLNLLFRFKFILRIFGDRKHHSKPLLRIFTSVLRLPVYGVAVRCGDCMGKVMEAKNLEA